MTATRATGAAGAALATAIAASAVLAAVPSTLTARHDPYRLVDQAFILGPTGDPTPGSSYISTVVSNYLAPNGYTGGDANAVALTTPEQDSGLSYTQGEEAVIEQLAQLQQHGELSAADPTWLFGYSQSSTILSWVDSNLHDVSALESTGVSAADAQAVAGIDPLALHVVLVGDDAANPGGGILSGFDNAAFTQPWLQLFGFPQMMGVDTNNDLSPTDVYTVAGDNWAQAQSFLSIPLIASWQHLAYLGLDASEFSHQATNGLTDYFGVADTAFNWLTVLWDALIAY